VSASGDMTHFSAPAFNVGTLKPGTQVVTSQLTATYDLHLGGEQIARLRQAKSLASRADAVEAQARFATALATTTDFYGVVSARELLKVARERVQRATDQLAVARARVKLGAAVPSDSLQVALELTRGRVDLLEREAALQVAQLQLGRRIGVPGAVDAALADTTLRSELPLSSDAAIRRAVSAGPALTALRADERAAGATLDAARSAWFPKLSLV